MTINAIALCNSVMFTVILFQVNDHFHSLLHSPVGIELNTSLTLSSST